MKLKKLLAVLSVCALIFALAVPVFASNASSGEIENPLENKFEGQDPNRDPSLTVSVAVLKGANKLYVNPYGLPYTIPAGTIYKADGITPSGDTIVEGTTTAGWFSTTSLIQNNSENDLKVKVTMTTTEKGGVKVIAPDDAAIDNFDTTAPDSNTLYGYLEITTATRADDGKITPDWKAATGGTDHANLRVVPVPAGSHTAGQAGTPAKDVVPDTRAGSSNGPIGFTLNKAGSKFDDATNAMVPVPSYAAFRIRGTAVLGAGSASGGNASDGNASGWLNTDLADVVVAFSFET